MQRVIPKAYDALAKIWSLDCRVKRSKVYVPILKRLCVLYFLHCITKNICMSMPPARKLLKCKVKRGKPYLAG